MTNRLDRRVAIVTGSTSGIGRAVAERFAAEGAHVVLNSARSADAGHDLAAALPSAVYVQGDIADEATAHALVDAATSEWGRLDVVVNNAGAATMLDHRDLDGHTDEVWRSMLDVNLMGTWYLCRAATPALVAAGDGAIVNITSLAGLHPTGSGSSIAYGVSKAAVNHLTVLLANSLGGEGVRVNAIAVGPIETPMWGTDAETIREIVRDRTVLGRPGRPDEIAEVCVTLAAPGFVTGEIVTVDGGMRFRVPR